jgi:hypothetical protein
MHCNLAWRYCAEDRTRNSVVNWRRKALGSHTEEVTGSDDLGDIGIPHLEVLHKVDDWGIQGESLTIGKGSIPLL